MLLVSLSACGESSFASEPAARDTGESIIGGTLVEDGEFPAVVSLGGCSGTLVHPSLVVYAEHCGTSIAEVRFGAHAETPERVVATDRCRGFPGARLGDGTDLAYCVLEAAVLDVEPERVLAGCELAGLERGTEVILVGYGVDRDGGTYGEKRVARSRIESIGDELLLEPGGADTCRGDSGGPVFIERREPDGTVERRLAGVTSAGTEAECGKGVGHYVHIGHKLDWLEEASQLDLSPCFERGSWSPTPACVGVGTGSRSDAGQAREDLSAPYLRSCGEAFALPADEHPPLVQWTKPARDELRYRLPAGAAYAELELSVEAADSDWGVQRVSFTLLDGAGRTLFNRDDEIAPYGFPLFRIPPGRFELIAEAVDFAGNGSSASLPLVVHEEGESVYLAGGCAHSPRSSRTLAWPLLLMTILLSWRARGLRHANGK